MVARHTNLAQLTRSRFAEQMVLGLLRGRGEAIAHTAWHKPPVDRLINALCARGYDFIVTNTSARVIAEPLDERKRVER